MGGLNEQVFRAQDPFVEEERIVSRVKHQYATTEILTTLVNPDCESSSRYRIVVLVLHNS